MKKLPKLDGKETLTKEQMKKITGGYNCRTGPTNFVCSTPFSGTYTVPCDNDCFVGEGNDACSATGGFFVECACA